MIIFPAIDLRGGRVVRLRQGADAATTVYSDQPAETALRWEREGASWLHVVNLDGAFGEASPLNLQALESVLEAVSIPVQFGGGLRTLEAMEAALARGVRRLVLGTVAIENPALVSLALGRFGPERIVVGIDARGGRVAIRGWSEQSTETVLQVALRMAALGVERIVYTEIERDGMLGGIDAEGMARLARESGIKVIASGGVANLRDVQALQLHSADGIEGVIIGQALYAGRFRLAEALALAGGDQIAR